MEIPVIERTIAIEELYDYHAKGQLDEAFGTGTAAVISPIGELNWCDNKIILNKGRTGELSAKLYDNLTGIQNGLLADPFGWMVEASAVNV